MIVNKPRAEAWLKPWAILFSHFVAIAHSPTRAFADTPIPPLRRHADTLPKQPALFDKPHHLREPRLRLEVCHHEGPITSHLLGIGSHDFQ
jgi:hypothetical protein